MKRTKDEKASNTAGYTCFSRACATREVDERLKGPDYLAEIFLPSFAAVILNVPVFRKFFMSMIAPSGIYEYVIARTKLFDQMFLNGLENHISQIVIMGAGMDTRALRFAQKNHGTKVFELDIERTQDPKIEILKRKSVELPDELIFVPIDFNSQSLKEVLAHVGFQMGQLNLFLWEGVTMYLAPQAVDATMDFIRENSQTGSLLVFDYIYASVLRRENKYYGEEEIFNTVSGAGEGWTFGIAEGEVENFLSERGYQMKTHYASTDLEEKYFKGEDGTAIKHINGTHCIVQASVV